MDKISNLPDHLVDKILCSLPLIDAVKTSGLARAWRYKWVTLIKLIFDKEFWDCIPKGKEIETFVTILLQYDGQLQEFYLYARCHFDDGTKMVNKVNKVIVPSIQFALRKGVTRLSFKNYPSWEDLPSCVFSSLQLTHLELEEHSYFTPPTSFHGLQNLISFKIHYRRDGRNLEDWEDEADNIKDFISTCPNIQRIWLEIVTDKEFQLHAPKLEYMTLHGDYQRICFQETKNLRYLELESSVDDFDDFRLVNFDCLVKLQHLVLEENLFQGLVSTDVPMRFSQQLDQLKVLELRYVVLQNCDQVHGLLCLFASSPNLCKLSVQINDICDDVEFESYLDLYRDHKFGNLHTVNVLTGGSNLDIKMIEFLLSCSPSLEMMSIECEYPFKTLKEEVKRLSRAFPKASVKFL